MKFKFLWFKRWRNLKCIFFNCSVQVQNGLFSNPLVVWFTISVICIYRKMMLTKWLAYSFSVLLSKYGYEFEIKYKYIFPTLFNIGLIYNIWLCILIFSHTFLFYLYYVYVGLCSWIYWIFSMASCFKIVARKIFIFYNCKKV